MRELRTVAISLRISRGRLGGLVDVAVGVLRETAARREFTFLVLILDFLVVVNTAVVTVIVDILEPRLSAERGAVLRLVFILSAILGTRAAALRFECSGILGREFGYLLNKVSNMAVSDVICPVNLVLVFDCNKILGHITVSSSSIIRRRWGKGLDAECSGSQRRRLSVC